MSRQNHTANPDIRRILFGLVFLWLWSPISCFAQGQQPTVLINFEQFSAPVPTNSQYGVLAPPLTVGAATFTLNNGCGGGVLRNQGFWSVDQSNVFGACFGIPESPQHPDNNCSGGLEIDFRQKVSNFSAYLLSTSESVISVGPATYMICDDQGGNLQVTLPVGGGQTISLPENGIRRVSIFPTTLGGEFAFWAVDNVRYTPIDPVWLDPVEGFLGGDQVTTDTEELASGGIMVSNIAADGVTQAVVRIPANYPGETLNVTLQDENGNPCGGDDGVADDGGVFALGDSSQSADCNVDVTAVATTSAGPMAFVVYLSSENYARNPQQYPQDQTTESRAISLKIQSDDDPNYKLTTNASVIRPPVVLVHGLWGMKEDWSRDGFEMAIAAEISGIFVQAVDYYSPLLQVTATYPTYANLGLNTPIPSSALGFSYNAGIVNTQIRKSISDFKESYDAASVTADIVAHSMGGDIVRTMALNSWFTTNDTYGHGPVNKLMTIGTPHLGSPLATQLLEDSNACVRNQLSDAQKWSFITVTTNTGMINGGVGDLQGDGFGGGLSDALKQLHNAGPLPFPMARLSATTDINNLSSLDCTPSSDWPCDSWWLRQIACPTSPLATNLTSTLWNTVFGQNNDAVVPIISQLNGGSVGPNVPTQPGLIHSVGMETLDFSPPTELFSGSAFVSQVITLLNEQPDGCDFKSGGC